MQVHGQIALLVQWSLAERQVLSLVPRPHPLTRRNGLVNQVEFQAHTIVNH